ncbi:MAG: LemA family protein [Magnetococcales bacterium]|nr:LemA family protein [Magnetococcales bacterium]
MTDKDKYILDELEQNAANSERMRRMKRMMRELYKDEFESKRFRLRPVKARSLIVFLSFASIIVFGVTTLYNFNRFVNLEERVLTSNGHVEDVLQRRVNLFSNLINLTLNQAALERNIFRHVADVRSNIGKGIIKQQQAKSAAVGAVVKTNSAATANTAQAVGNQKPGLPTMAKLLAVVEQYPKIRTSKTYQQLMDKLVEIENRIATRRDEYNEEVRIYNTLISSFPWYVLAKVTGFKRHEYFHLSYGKSKGEFKLPDISKHKFKRLLPIPKN